MAEEDREVQGSSRDGVTARRDPALPPTSVDPVARLNRPKPARGKALGILNPYGDLWTYDTFDTEEDARRYVRDFWAGIKGDHDLTRYRVVPVRITVSAAAGVERRPSRAAPKASPQGASNASTGRNR